MIPYIVAENPNMDRHRVYQLSKEMMMGHKMELFMFWLSFIGWIILSIVTFSLGAIFYMIPYINAATAEFYLERRREVFEKRITGPNELFGFEKKEEKFI